MKINTNSEKKKNISKLFAKTEMAMPSMAYQLHVKAEALRLASLHKEAISKYLNSIIIDRNNAEAYYGLGICYKSINKMSKAIDAFEKAKELREFDFNIYYELGVCYLNIGDVCCAIKHLINALRLNPNNLNAQIQLALAHEIIEEEDMALMIYQKIIETNPGYIKAYDSKSSLLMRMERYQEASYVLSLLIKKNPDYYRAYLGIAICFDKMNKLPDATRYYKKFLDYKPNSQHSDFVHTRLNEINSSRNLDKSKSVNSILKIVR